MFNFSRKPQEKTNAFTSRLFDEKSFYTSFLKDLRHCRKEVIIESPFITSKRVDYLYPVFERLINKGVKTYVITRDPNLHEEGFAEQSETEIRRFEELGIQVLTAQNYHHRKLAILDRQILWEGSLNILSQARSREIMRRIEGKDHAQEMFDFLQLGRFI